MITPKEYLNTYSSKLPLLGKLKKKFSFLLPYGINMKLHTCKISILSCHPRR